MCVGEGPQYLEMASTGFGDLLRSIKIITMSQRYYLGNHGCSWCLFSVVFPFSRRHCAELLLFGCSDSKAHCVTSWSRVHRVSRLHWHALIVSISDKAADGLR